LGFLYEANQGVAWLDTEVNKRIVLALIDDVAIKLLLEMNSWCRHPVFILAEIL